MAIYRRKDKNGAPTSSYRICVYLGLDSNGKKLYHFETFNGPIIEARKRERQIHTDRDTGKYTKPLKKIKTGEFLDLWLKDYSAPNMAPRTHEVYTQQVNNHVKPVIGSYLLTALTAPVLSSYYSNRLEYGLSAQTVTHHRTMLHKAFETAREWGYLSFNPVDGSTSVKVQRPEMVVWSVDEVKQFLDMAAKSEYYTLFHTMLHTGMRRSEALALKWENIDLMFGVIHINRSLHQRIDTQYVIRQTKTAKSRRSVPLTPSNFLVIQKYLEYYKDILKKIGEKFSDDRLVFCELDTGDPLRPNTISRAWVMLTEKAKLKHIPLHNARHTHATILLKMGIHPKIVQERLGHSTINTTLDLYSHVTPSMQLEAAKSFDAAFTDSYNK